MIEVSVFFFLKKLITYIYMHRPHGQHSVVLAEDAAKYTDCRSDRGGDLPASSHQIYLTFPSDSNFTEDDVANYFGYSFILLCDPYII